MQLKARSEKNETCERKIGVFKTIQCLLRLEDVCKSCLPWGRCGTPGSRVRWVSGRDVFD
jgi:hypothetical protein